MEFGYDYIMDLEPGVKHLNGAQALAYSRIRYIGTDFGRTERQRIVIQTVFQKMKDEPWSNLLNIYDKVAGDLTTDMTNDQILEIALAAYGLGVDSIEEYRVPADGTYSGQTVRKMSVLVPNDWNTLRAALQEFIYGQTAETAQN